MFGRRPTDRPHDPPPAPHKPELDLGMLDDLPTLPAAEAKPAAPAQARTAPEPSWSANTMLGPSVTQLLREAEVASQPVPPAPPAQPAPPITQQLSAVELEPAFAAVHEQLWTEPDTFTAPAGYEPEDDLSSWQEAQLTHELAEPMPTLASELSLPAESLWNEPAIAPEPPAPTPPAPEPAPLPARAAAESLIGPDDFFDGHYRSERGVRIQGKANGAIESRQYILVEAGAQVEADLTAEEIVIAGSFTGKIVCRGRLEVLASGAIQGTVSTAALVVHAGGILEGELHMRRAEG